MAGKKCPKCGNLTFHQTPTGGECSNCGYVGKTSPGAGRGKKCPICNEYRIFEVGGIEKCRGCGTTFS